MDRREFLKDTIAIISGIVPLSLLSKTEKKWAFNVPKYDEDTPVIMSINKYAKSMGYTGYPFGTDRLMSLPGLRDFWPMPGLDFLGNAFESRALCEFDGLSDYLSGL